MTYRLVFENCKYNAAGLPVGLEGLIVAAASALRPVCGGTVHARRRTVAIFLPRNSDLHQISAAIPHGAKWEVERNVLNGHLKGITLYIWL